MTATQSRPWMYGTLMAGLTVITCAAVVVTQGNIGAVAAPVVGVSVLLAIWNLPLRIPVTGLFVALMVLDNPQDRPAEMKWSSPLGPIGEILFNNLNKLTNIEALRMAPLDLALAGLVGLAVWRAVSTAAVEKDPTRLPTPRPLAIALIGGFGGVLLIEAFGILRGGDLKNSLWQIRQIGAVPLVALLLLAALRGVQDARMLGVIVVTAAWVKALEGAYFFAIVARAIHYKPVYVTTHADTVLFVTAFVILLVNWYESRTKRALMFLVGGGGLLLVAMGLNNRRLAWVALAASLLVIYAIVPWSKLKLNVTRLGIASLPVVALYVVAGMASSSGIFKPVHLAMSVLVSKTDRSTQTRDIENYNLVLTLKTNPVMGTGFGHEYNELSKADDISKIFAQYRYIPHNSLLGLWAFSGFVGFSLIWFPLVFAVFLAARTYPRARDATHRAGALVVISICVTYSAQCYGDMGLQSWQASFLLAGAIAVSSKLAVAVGAWPANHPAPRTVTT